MILQMRFKDNGLANLHDADRRERGGLLHETDCIPHGRRRDGLGQMARGTPQCRQRSMQIPDTMPDIRTK